VRQWHRQTAERRAEELPPAFRAAVDAYAEREGLGDLLDAETTVCSTRSEPTDAAGRGLFRRPPPPYETWLLLSATALVVVSDASGSPVAIVFRPGDLDVRRFSSPLVDDDGLEVTGAAVGASERATLFLPLDDGPAGRAFAAALQAAAGGP